MIPKLFVYVPELKRYLPAQVPGSDWDIQFWRAIYKAEGRCTALIHMGNMPRYRITVRAA